MPHMVAPYPLFEPTAVQEPALLCLVFHLPPSWLVCAGEERLGWALHGDATPVPALPAALRAPHRGRGVCPGLVELVRPLGGERPGAPRPGARRGHAPGRRREGGTPSSLPRCRRRLPASTP